MTGPFETERDAQNSPEVQAIFAAIDASPGTGRMFPHNHRMLEEACNKAGVELGAYDHRILAWLSGYEPATCAVIAGIISRARADAAIINCDTCARLYGYTNVRILDGMCAFGHRVK